MIRDENYKQQEFTLKTKDQINEEFEKGDALVMEDEECLAKYVY